MNVSKQFKIAKTEGVDRLNQSGKEFIELFSHGTMNIEIYKPHTIDKQRPHSRDELYVIIAGKAMFFMEGAIINVDVSDCLFVPARAEHRFFNFSDDFTTWVFFYGPEGGE